MNLWQEGVARATDAHIQDTRIVAFVRVGRPTFARRKRYTHFLKLVVQCQNRVTLEYEFSMGFV